MQITKGMEFTNAKTGRKVVVLDVKPAGRLEMGQRMTGTPPAGLSGIVRQWNTTMHSVRSLIESGRYIATGGIVPAGDYGLMGEKKL